MHIIYKVLLYILTQRCGNSTGSRNIYTYLSLPRSSMMGRQRTTAYILYRMVEPPIRDEVLMGSVVQATGGDSQDNLGIIGRARCGMIIRLVANSIQFDILSSFS